MDFVIRSATDGDEAAILGMGHRLEEWVAGWRDPDAVAAAVVGWVEESFRMRDEPGNALFVAEVDDAVVGFVSVAEQEHWTGETDAYIGELVVSRDAEGHGLGTALIRSAVDWARTKGIKRVSVATGMANAPARRLYASLGFEEESVTLSSAV